MLSRLYSTLRVSSSFFTARRCSSSVSSSHLDIDLYADDTPFTNGPLKALTAFPEMEDRSALLPETGLPPLLLPTNEPLRQSAISRSFFFVNKKPGALLDYLTKCLASSFNSKEFYIASSGTLDILASGMALLCSKGAMDAIDHFDSLAHSYSGVLMLGRVSDSYDLKTPIVQYHPWKHIKDDELMQTAASFVGDILLPPSPFDAQHSRKSVPYYLMRRIGNPMERPCIVHRFDVSRRNALSPEVEFELVSDAILDPASLAHSLGKKLSCGAVLSELKKTAIGEYTLDVAWDTDVIFEAFFTAAEGAIWLPSDPDKANLKLRMQRYAQRIVGRNWQKIYRPPKKRKLKPFELRYFKRRRLEDEAKGLISKEEIMKRRLSKKAVKLVANLNVEAIEDTFETMQNE